MKSKLYLTFFFDLMKLMTTQMTAHNVKRVNKFPIMNMWELLKMNSNISDRFQNFKKTSSVSERFFSASILYPFP